MRIANQSLIDMANKRARAATTRQRENQWFEFWIPMIYHFYFIMYYLVSRCLMMIHLMRYIYFDQLMWFCIYYHPMRNMFQNFQFSNDMWPLDILCILFIGCIFILM
jgi:hypothetical protein